MDLVELIIISSRGPGKTLFTPRLDGVARGRRFHGVDVLHLVERHPSFGQRATLARASPLPSSCAGHVVGVSEAP